MLLAIVLLVYSVFLVCYVYNSERSLQMSMKTIVNSAACHPNIQFDDHLEKNNSKYVWKNSQRNNNICYLNIRIISLL